MNLSICMVSLNCWPVLENCIESIRASSSLGSYEIIIVDNASDDDTVRKIKHYYPEVKLIQNSNNIGFTAANNQAINDSCGEYILWLNTDTVLMPDALNKMYQFMDAHPNCGIVGPKVLNSDGSFQPQCRRGMPTPFSSLCYFLKMDRLWPNNPKYNQYLLSYLPIDEPSEVVAVSGCCLMARRAVWNDIGPLDEDIFGFGEDIDWCIRAKKAGWEVWYNPNAVITHLKGQGGAHSKPYLKAVGIHQAMWVFFRKHLKINSPWYMPPIVFAGIKLHFFISCLGIFLKNIFKK